MSATSELSPSKPASAARPRRWRAPRGLATFLAAYVAVYAVAAICGWVGDNSGVLIRDLAYGALSIFALISMVRASRREQCDSGQGFLFARPLPPAEIERFLDATPSAVAERTSA